MNGNKQTGHTMQAEHMALVMDVLENTSYGATYWAHSSAQDALVYMAKYGTLSGSMVEIMEDYYHRYVAGGK